MQITLYLAVAGRKVHSTNLWKKLYHIFIDVHN